MCHRHRSLASLIAIRKMQQSITIKIGDRHLFSTVQLNIFMIILQIEKKAKEYDEFRAEIE